MAYTLLNSINAVLKRVQIVQGDSSALTSLTDSARQNYIDVAVQVWNEVIHELYSVAQTPLPQELTEASSGVTLAEEREYDLPADLEQIRWPLIDQTDGYQIFEYPGGFDEMRRVQLIPSDWTGQPNFAVINPATGKLRLDTTPTSAEAGRVYVLWYDKRLIMDAAEDTFPFSDTVVDSLVPAVAQLWSRDIRNSFDAAIFDLSVGRAARYMTKQQPRRKW